MILVEFLKANKQLLDILSTYLAQMEDFLTEVTIPDRYSREQIVDILKKILSTRFREVYLQYCTCRQDLANVCLFVCVNY
jgi:hypothetical protein